MPRLIRIPTLLVALGLLLSGGQATVCEMVSLAGIDLHAPVEHCDGGSDHEHSHSHSDDSEPCESDCLVTLDEAPAPTEESLPPISAVEVCTATASNDSMFRCGAFACSDAALHGSPPLFLQQPPAHSEPAFLGRFQV